MELQNRAVMLCRLDYRLSGEICMFKILRAGLVAVAMVALVGCAVKDGWRGAAAEGSYDKELAARRLAEDLNNDDYWELHRDGRIYVLSDLKAYQSFLQTDEIPLVVTRIGAGPKGETVKLALVKDEAKAMEKMVGFKGGAQRLFEGEIKGLDKGFYGEVHREGVVHVFADWAELDAFRKSGSAQGAEVAGGGPKGEKLVFVGKADSAETRAQFAKVYGK